MQRAYSVLNVKKVADEADEWIVEGVASTPRTDRSGDIVEPMGAKFKLPMPLLWQHDSTQPIGRVEFASPTPKGIPFRAHIPKVVEAGRLKDRIDEAVQSIKYRLVACVSIGFQAFADSVERIETGLRFKTWEWLELSLVTIPANADATITGVKSIDTELRRAAFGAQAKSSVVRLDPSTPGVSGKKRPGVVYLNP
jgi:HK97 family phage prohead protease